MKGFIKALPRAELHVQMEGTLEPEFNRAGKQTGNRRNVV